MASFADGRVLDLFASPPAPPRHGRLPPDVVMSAFPTYRWRKYFNNIALLPEPERTARFADYAGWLCRRENARAAPEARVETVLIVFHGARTGAGGRREPFDWPIGAFACPR